MFAHVSRIHLSVGAVTVLFLGVGLVHVAFAATLSVSCSGSPASPAVGDQVTWTAVPGGGGATGSPEWGLYGYGDAPWTATGNTVIPAGSVSFSPGSLIACSSFSPTPYTSDTPTSTGPPGTTGSVCSSVGTICINDYYGCQPGGPGNCVGNLLKCYAGVPIAPSYTYSWTGTDGLLGNTNPVQKAYATAGTKNATVTVTTGGVSSGAGSYV